MANCGSCKFHVSGTCRLHPPQPVQIVTTNPPDSRWISIWPQVGINDWCGDFQQGK